MAEAVQHFGDAAPQPETRPGGKGTNARRAAAWVKWGSLAVIIVCLVLIGRLLPLDNGARYLMDWVGRLGVWAPIVFGLIYLLAALLFIPGVLLTLAAGALFGLLLGTVTVSIASTVAAAVAFFVARYVARGAVERAARRYPRFDAIDRAIGAGGWKIIALLRLSPAVPFSAGNYLFGLTAARFWPYVLASWLGMLPGTFLYIYLGYLGRTGLAGAPRTPGEWALLIAGLLATIAATVYITYLARKHMRRHMGDAARGASIQGEQRVPRPPSIRSAILAAAALLLLVATGWSYRNSMRVRSLLGPPSVTLQEAYAEDPAGRAFDHSALDELVKKHVAPGDWVDYEGLRRDAGQLDAYIAAVGAAPFDELGRDEKLALLINAYNAFTLRLILDYYPLKSIKDIPAAKRWDDKRWTVGRHTWSLNRIEHEEIRPKFKDARVHFALVCAAIGCPVLRREAYIGSRIDEQLEDQTRYAHEQERWFRFEPEKNLVHLTSLYQWYAGDFEQVAGSVLNFAARYAPGLKSALDAGREPTIQWIEYDWTLNSKENQR